MGVINNDVKRESSIKKLCKTLKELSAPLVRLNENKVSRKSLTLTLKKLHFDKNKFTLALTLT